MFKKLEEYIKKSRLVIINDDLSLRMNEELFLKYKQGLYDNQIKLNLKYIEELKELNIVYPNNVKPKYYFYIVPDDEFRELLNFPNSIKSNGGGKIVPSFESDGFNNCYGVSSNIFGSSCDDNIISKINLLHELSHLILGMFRRGIPYIHEGFAEALPLYTLGYEEKYIEHQKVLSILKEEQIITMRELIKMSETTGFHGNKILPINCVQFEIAYISCYLFVRGILEVIESKYNLNRIEATQKFLNILGNLKSYNEKLIIELAIKLDLNPEELLDGKSLQISVLDKLVDTDKEQLWYN